MKKNTKQWYLLKLEKELTGPVEIVVNPDKLLTAEQAMLVIQKFK